MAPIIYSDDKVVVRAEWRIKGLVHEFSVYVHRVMAHSQLEAEPAAYLLGDNSLIYKITQVQGDQPKKE